MKYATNTVSENCGQGNAWRCVEVADMGVLPLNALDDYHQIHTGLSLALDKSMFPLIAYQDTSNPLEPASLRLARPAAALGNLTGNCGPMGFWQCNLLDPSPLTEADEADYVSLAVAADGLGVIAYSEDRASDDQGWRLKLAFQQFGIFLPTILK